jgi:ParB-like chromosome segregation protein Spo0J
MTSNLEFKLADTGDGTILGGYTDPKLAIEQLAEVNVPIGLLKPWFHLRQEGTDAAHVRLLADAAGSVRLPPILVQRRDLRIIDGMHRVEVARLRGETSIAARIVDCTDEEALVLAVKSNTLHGLPLTRADRISSAKRILCAHPDWSDRALASITGLSAKSVSSIRNSATADAPFNGKRLGRDGKRRPVTSADGRQRAAEYISAHPGASLREIAREAGISLGTVHDVKGRLRRGDPVQPPGQLARPVADWSGQDPGRPAVAPDPSALDNSPRPLMLRPVPRQDWQAIAAKIAGDPTVRYTEGGRAFLRWMASHAAQADEWAEFIDAIPGHWREEVGRTAASISEEWRLFADRLRSELDSAI